jgi:NAD(P)-dependent dehydrogenase (short-subunit alcohol dehydrogenase family)
MHDRPVALVTGANKGIGFETVRQLAARGMTVLLGARDPARGQEAARSLRAAGADVRFLPLDVTDAGSIATAARWIEAELGRLDVLVNNAGIAVDADPPSRADLGRIRTTFEVNVLGAIAVTCAMLPLLRRGPAGRIVNVSSGLGSLALSSDPQWEHADFTTIGYPASKAALNMVTVQLAKELRDTRIKVNAADPGFTATDLNGHHGTQTAEEGARAAVQLATLDADGPSGGFFDARDRVPW